MRGVGGARIPAFAVAVGLCLSAPLSAQTVHGTVLDASTGGPVSMAGVHLLDRDRDTRLIAMTDSLGRYTLTVPDSGEYILVAERFGYRDLESPLFAISDARDYTFELELQPAPLGLGGINVTVQSDQAVDWIRREIGRNPTALFGFRLLQGDRLAEAKVKGKYKPTETLRWLYIPVSHGPKCIGINNTPRPASVGVRGARQSLFVDPGEAPAGTSEPQAAVSGDPADGEFWPEGCGTLTVNDRIVPNDLFDDLDMTQIAVVITLPNAVRMYTFDFQWTFR